MRTVVRYRINVAAPLGFNYTKGAQATFARRNRVWLLKLLGSLLHGHFMFTEQAEQNMLWL